MGKSQNISQISQNYRYISRVFRSVLNDDSIEVFEENLIESFNSIFIYHPSKLQIVLDALSIFDSLTIASECCKASECLCLLSIV